jgi:hypothetical protein
MPDFPAAFFTVPCEMMGTYNFVHFEKNGFPKNGQFFKPLNFKFT